MVESSKVTGVTDFICVAAIDSLSAHEVKEVDGIWGVGCSGGEVVVELLVMLEIVVMLSMLKDMQRMASSLHLAASGCTL